jgi:hypothetical protein
METPQKYKENIEKGIITQEILAACLYSVNKRAKNCRDKEREYRSRYRHSRYDTAETYRWKKEEYYRQKEIFLSLLEPDCIHVEKQQRRLTIYEGDERFATFDQLYEVVYRSNVGRKYYTVSIPFDKYYLFYDLGAYSFHTPIEECDLSKYPDLDQVRIDGLHTHGKDILDLVSTQFVEKVLKLIASKNYTYVG